jgi:predicted RecB family endonuclease
VVEKLRADSWSVALEEPVNGYADIIAEKDNRRVAIEIETGKSDYQANLQKNLAKGFKEILIITTNNETQQKISAELESITTDAQIWVEQAQEFAE